jgi:hypothetical protein
MPSPIEAAGATRNPSRFAALTQNARELTGLVTQRSPYRDGAVPYVASKYYNAGRFDTLSDGINREMSARMTDRRRPGCSIFNDNIFPAIRSFYSWKYIQDAAEIVRTIVDGSDGTIYDATPGQKTALFAKSAGAGAARMLGVNTQLFIGDGVEAKKILRSAKTWKAATKFSTGEFIIDSNGNIQSIQANPVTYNIASIAVIAAVNSAYDFYLVVTFHTDAPVMPANQTCTFAGLTNYVALNGQVLTWQGISSQVIADLNPSSKQLIFGGIGSLAYPDTADTGTVIALTNTDGLTAGAPPVWSAVWGQVTNDGGTNGGVNWTCFGSPVQNWGVTPITPANPIYSLPTVPANPNAGPLVRQGGTVSKVSCWSPQLPWYLATTQLAILDANGNVQVTQVGAGDLGGTRLPNWALQIGALTKDGTLLWMNYGPIAPWYALTNYGGATSQVGNPCVILDSNGNLQYTNDVNVAQTSGAAAPAWATAIGANTADGAITWTCAGPGNVLWSGIYKYGWSAHCIDGSVSTISPLTLVANGGIGPSGGFQLQVQINISGTAAHTDKQVDQLYIWRTAQGKATPILLDSIPNPFLKGDLVANYQDVSEDGDLFAQIPAPLSLSNDPPDATITAPIYHLQRIWAIVKNAVVYSGGPDTITGNGNTSFPPLNEIPYPAQPIRIEPVTVQGGGILVFTTDGVYIILGTGTPNDPFYTTLYYASVSITGFDAVDVNSNQIYLMESNNKVSTLAVEYPFNPQTGYNEIGFPIGDQFKKVTTGAISAALYDPARAFVTWNQQSSGETALYIADGAVGWFRMNMLMAPESGLAWSPRAAIVGGTSAVQSISTSSGRSQLLIGPRAGTTGPILTRDDTGTIWQDNAASYPAWDVKGVNLLCSTGQWAEIAHVAAKSMPVGKRPVISVLLGEISASVDRPWVALDLGGNSNDPADTPRSLSVFSDRYRLAQNGFATTGDCISTKFDYGVQAYGDELLDWAIFAAIHEEMEEAAAKI